MECTLSSDTEATLKRCYIKVGWDAYDCKVKPARRTLERGKPSIFGTIQRDEEVVIHVVANVPQPTIQRLGHQTIQPGARIYTDENAIYGQLEAWGYCHQTSIMLKESTLVMMTRMTSAKFMPT